MLAAIVRSALEDETFAAMLKARMDAMTDRLERYEHTEAEKRRQLVRDVMLETDIKKPDAGLHRVAAQCTPACGGDRRKIDPAKLLGDAPSPTQKRSAGRAQGWRGN